MKSSSRWIGGALALALAAIALPAVLFPSSADWKASPVRPAESPAEDRIAERETLEFSSEDVDRDTLLVELERIEAALPELIGAAATAPGEDVR